MAIQVGPLVRRLRERWRMTQQDLVEYTGLDRSASYISSIETGRTSPTLVELEALARVFRTTLIEMLQEAEAGEARFGREADSAGGRAPGAPRSGGPVSGAGTSSGAPTPAERAAVLVTGMGEAGQTLALELLELLAERERRRE